ncbi:unnamed protein product [Ceutorhynchus assimilis]|uniref:Uncharacterized protein n=1 Tax=Ceutorhynchus assimilis TaxID=467358 RepID=A0A9N9QLL3_9CUCU|nr:unnamed protein product [Ceutorhynchus assimilis]
MDVHDNKKSTKHEIELIEDTNESDNDLREPFSDIDLSDREDPTYVQSCEVPRCKQEIDKKPAKKIMEIPEDFPVEWSPREYQHVKQPRTNKRKLAKALRNSGKEYVSVKTQKRIPMRKIGPACNAEWCKKGGRECRKFTEEIRQAIFSDFYNLADLQLQREFLVRFVEQKLKKSNTKPDGKSRRTYTKTFFLPFNGEPTKVCRKMFISTLDVGEKVLRNAVKKVQSTGVLEKEKRGGRDKISALKDRAVRDSIINHINKFPRVESHYYRKDSSREYLHGDLSLRKMYDMFIEELQSTESKPSFSLYRFIFKKINLSFHRPKKDQCGTCRVYHQASEEEKIKIKEIFDKHIVEKEAVRELKENFKSAAKNDPKIFCACFDLQQRAKRPLQETQVVAGPSGVNTNNGEEDSPRKKKLRQQLQLQKVRRNQRRLGYLAKN